MRLPRTPFAFCAEIDSSARAASPRRDSAFRLNHLTRRPTARSRPSATTPSGYLHTIDIHTIVFIVLATVAPIGSDRVECPICAGRGTTLGRLFSTARESRYVCGLCGGDGSMKGSQLHALPQLREQMQRVADLMQAGDADGAAKAARVAFQIATSIIP